MELDQAMTGSTAALDPANTERAFYRDPFTGVQREIWRPGDGDGDQGTEFFDRDGPPLPLEKRWRLFQSDLGRMDLNNQPPRFVMLDDCAAYQVLQSNITRAKLTQHWPHDFAGAGKLRSRRPHRGRASVKDTSAEGNEKFHSITMAGRQDLYYFTGEPDYQPTVYLNVPPQPVQRPKRKRKPERGDPDYNPRGHGHNQYTPKDQMVKHGAPTFSTKPQVERVPRINAFLPRQPTPPFGRTPHGGLADGTRVSGTKQRELHEEEAAVAQRDAVLGVTSRPSLSQLFNMSGTTVIDNLAKASSENENSDDEFPVRRPKSDAHDVADPALEVPQDMSFIERRALEKKLAARTIAGIQSMEDIARVANELAQANVKIRQQAQEIERLQKALLESRNEKSSWVEPEAGQRHVDTPHKSVEDQDAELGRPEDEDG